VRLRSLEWFSRQLSRWASGLLIGPVHCRAHLPIVAHLVNSGPTRLRNPGMIRVVNLRIGIGTDVHRLAPGRSMRVAGLDWPEEEVGPEGHSDGDVVLHAVCDALLSAAGLGDLGGSFGTSDPQWAGVASDELLAETLRRVRAAGWEVGNVACQLIGNRPRFSARREEAERGITERHGIDVSISATTTDGLGLTGRGEGLAAIATAIVTSSAVE
jgi:2-C-methyl-D-erythritol 2,4-cyclodiphosphate synthase